MSNSGDGYYVLNRTIWRPSSLSELTPIIFHIEFNSLMLEGIHI